MIVDRDNAYTRLARETEATEQTGGLLLEDIGGYDRLHLRALAESRLRLDTVNGLFCYTANHANGTMQGFEEKLHALEELACCGKTPFSQRELTDYLASYRLQGHRDVSHTQVYRDAYKPAYRLVPKQTKKMLSLLQRIDRILNEKGTCRVAIDGMCGSGKTTLGAVLAEVYEAQLFHMDDYFLPIARKTPQRLAEPGGNVDYERFYEEIGSRGIEAPIVYRRFDCTRQETDKPTVVPPNAVRIVEGSYSLHPYFGDIYDVKVWMQVDEGVQIERIRKRNGEEKLQRFLKEWIPMENHYARAFDIAKNCLVLSGE